MKNIAQKKIYFGHQSVGYNIVEGIQEIIAQDPASRAPAIKETRSPGDFNAPVFAHSTVGANKDPYSKIDDFKRLMDSGLGNKVDIAFFKLCYVDVDTEQNTDINKLFSYYRETMEYLENKYPKTVFVHMTVPVRTLATGLKADIKRKLGRNIWGDNDNILREKYNALLRQEYASKGRLFDLAKYEITDNAGRENYLSINNVPVPAMRPEYTDDKGHLNNKGREYISSTLLKFLGNQ